jgi:uncharacterized protein YeaO (DUF488 family)
MRASLFVYVRDMIKCKSIYHSPAPDDGERIFVDRLWPEGVTTRDSRVTSWMQELAPSYELWRFNFTTEKWTEYRRRYWQELSHKSLRPMLRRLKEKSESDAVTLLYGTSDDLHNNAVALKEYLENLNHNVGHE